METNISYLNINVTSKRCSVIDTATPVYRRKCHIRQMGHFLPSAILRNVTLLLNRDVISELIKTVKQQIKRKI